MTGAGPAMTGVAYVVEQTSVAMASGVKDSVVKQRQVTVNNGKGETTTFVYWTDATTKGRHAERLGADNEVLFTAVFPAGGDGITADYSAKTWWPEKFGILASTRGFMEPALPLDPADMKKWQASGGLKLIGTETVNGTETLHLHLQMPLDDNQSKDFWVDAKTYLLVKYVADAKGAGTWRTEYSWLPRTPENLAPFEVKPPAGFTQIPTPAPAS